MSIFFGVFNRNGSPVERTTTEAMYKGVAHCPHKHFLLLNEGNIALGFLDTTSESVSSPCIWHLKELDLLFVAVGRIDNRDELLASFGAEVCPSDCSDRRLMLQAYLKWGAQADEKLLGDWAFMAFHADSQRLFLSHDHQGNCAVDYYLDGGKLVFATNIHALLALPEIPRRPNLDTAVRTLLGWGGDTGFLSFFEDIHHLSPATHIEVTKTSVESARYWFPEHIEQAPWRGKSDDYAEKLYFLTQQAVAARLRQPKKTAAMLSGGLDSGTVAFLAARQMANLGAKLTTFSHVPLFDGVKPAFAGRTGDERPGIRATAAASGNIDSVLLKSEDLSPLSGIEQFLAVCQTPIHAACNAFWLLDIARSAAAGGIEELLTGDMGNGTISYAGFPAALPTARLWSWYGLPSVIKQKALRPLYHTLVSRARLRFGSAAKHAARYSHINPALFADKTITDTMAAEGFFPGARRAFANNREHMLAIMMPGQNPRGYYHSLMGDHFGIRYSDPTADRRLMEYVLTLPNEAFFGPRGQSKFLLKSMMAGALPESVLDNQKKGLQSSDVTERLRVDVDRLGELVDKFAKSEAVSMVLNTGRLREDWQSLRTVGTLEHGQGNRFLQAAMVGSFFLRIG